jgi:hypothetical protein
VHSNWFCGLCHAATVLYHSLRAKTSRLCNEQLFAQSHPPYFSPLQGREGRNQLPIVLCKLFSSVSPLMLAQSSASRYNGTKHIAFSQRGIAVGAGSAQCR